jgi:hypothetical protein
MTTIKSLTCFAVKIDEDGGAGFVVTVALPLDGNAGFGGVTSLALAFFFGGKVAVFVDCVDAEGLGFVTNFFTFFLDGETDGLAGFFVLAGVRFEITTCFFLE